MSVVAMESYYIKTVTIHLVDKKRFHTIAGVKLANIVRPT